VFRHNQAAIAQPNAALRICLDGSSEGRAGDNRMISIDQDADELAGWRQFFDAVGVIL
jgi:hypothetical protein